MRRRLASLSCTAEEGGKRGEPGEGASAARRFQPIVMSSFAYFILHSAA
jgi:hypothetical protein